MSKKSKRFKKILSLLDESGHCLSLQRIFAFFERYKNEASAKFDETVEVVLKLAIDPGKDKHKVKGVVVMPHGTGKDVKIAVFTRSENFEIARKAGAHIVGAEELIDEVKSGKLDFDACLATPDMMPKLATISKILYPKGLMPNPKLGTVTENIVEAVQQILAGQVKYESDVGGLIHARVGKLSFKSTALEENVKVLYDAVKSFQHTTHKGGNPVYVKGMCISTSQGPSVEVDMSTL